MTEGVIFVSSSLGELPIPVRAEVTEAQAESTLGAVQTLDDFTRLCMKSLRGRFPALYGRAV